MRQTSEKSGGGKEIIGNTEVHGGRGVLEMVREPVSMDNKGTANSPVLPLREAGYRVPTIQGERERDTAWIMTPSWRKFSGRQRGEQSVDNVTG